MASESAQSNWCDVYKLASLTDSFVTLGISVPTEKFAATYTCFVGHNSPLGISMQGLTKFYGAQRGVENITFDVKPGEVVGFLGPNGSGKTTVMRMLMGLLHITKGSATILGHSVSVADPSIRSQVGYLPGTLGLHKNQTVGEYLRYMAAMRESDCAQSIATLCERFAIDPSRAISSLSKGNKQKVGVIQAFMHSPRVLILDEPTSGLDPIVQREFETLLAEARDAGAAVLLSSHVMHEVEVLASRVAIINAGSLVVVGDVDTMKSQTVRSIKLGFSHPVPAHVFEQIAGVRSVIVHETWVECSVVGSENELLRIAVEQGVISVTSLEPTLEDIFISETGNHRVS